MTKSLVTISFALDVPEDELTEFATAVDEGVRNGIRNSMFERGYTAQNISAIEELVDFYGATITLRRSILDE